MKWNRIFGKLLCQWLVLAAGTALADVRLPAIFSDHAVLQRDATVPVWGWAEPGEEVTVSVAGQSRTTKADQQGKWRVDFANLQAGGPHTLTVNGKNTIAVNDVLIGEVWLGSGQSNMAMAVNRANNFEREAASANHSQIRMFTVTSGPSKTAQTDCKGAWEVCSPETVARFSATAYFFGREIHKALNVPVGLINSSVGGTPIESWIDGDAQRALPELKMFFELQKAEDAKFDAVAAKAKYEKDLAAWKEKSKAAKAAGTKAPAAPRDPVALRDRKGDVGGLFNGKIAPLIPYAIRGALWYQGEANSQDPKAPFYEHQLPLLVRDWRAKWGYEFPFAWVQLPNFTRAGEGWMLVREAMLKSLSVPKTGMAVTIDIGDPKDIHPKNKQDVGKRLAGWALAAVYGQMGVAHSGPLPISHKVVDDKIEIAFKHTECGLVARGGELKGFEIAGADGQWKPAKAHIEIVGGYVVRVSSPEVKEPIAVRYAWADNPVCNLFCGDGLPASPFRLVPKN